MDQVVTNTIQVTVAAEMAAIATSIVVIEDQVMIEVGDGGKKKKGEPKRNIIRKII